jgi:hypothetical protein
MTSPATYLMGRIPGRRFVPPGVRRRILKWMSK